jgi:hypothetical protein
MAKRWMCLWLLALGSLAFAQDDDEDDDTEIEIGNEGDPVPEEQPEDKAKPTEPAKPRGAFPKREPGQKHKAVEWQDRKKVYTLRFPDDWVVTEVEASGKDGVLGLEIRLPGSTGIARFDVLRFPTMGDPRGTPYYWQANDQATETLRLYRPVPRVVVTSPSGQGERVDAYAFRRIKGHPLALRLVCRKDDFDEATHADFVDAALSLEAKLDPWPAIPEDYTIKSKGRYLLAAQPGVESVREIEKILVAQERRFAKLHGKLPKLPRGESTVVFVQSTKEAAGRFSKRAAERPNEAMFDTETMCLFTLPVPKHDLEKASSLAWHVEGMLHILKYGQANPAWACDGERFVASAEIRTTKSLPYLHAGYAQWQNALPLKPIPELEDFRKASWEQYQKQVLWYVGLFRAGPSKYRKAYKAFCKEYATTLDWKAAMKTHIEPLGYDDIRVAAEKFAVEIRLFEPKAK